MKTIDFKQRIDQLSEELDQYFKELFEKTGVINIPEDERDKLIFNPDSDCNVDGGNFNIFAGIDEKGNII